MKQVVVAKVLLVGPDEKILLLKRSDDDFRRPGEYDIPGGHTDGNEYGNDAAARETAEEAGIAIDARDLKLVYSETKVVESDMNVVWLLFVAQTSNTEIQLSSEHSEFRWADMNEAIELLDYDRQKRMLTHVRDNGLLHG